MDYIYSIILGIIQALTEFLPISSSAHLVIFHNWLKSDLLNNLTFDVILHAGTFIAVLVYFWPEVASLVKIFFKTLWRAKISAVDSKERLPWLLLVATVPAVAVGYFFDGFIENIFRSVYWVIIPLIIGGLLLIIFDRWGKKNRSLNSLNFFDALLIGLSQILAFLPGTSRSGITIICAMGRGFTRAEAAKFSFLLSLPVILGAIIKKVSQISLADQSLKLILIYFAGAIMSAVAGVLVIKFFLRFLSGHSLTVFAIYRFLLAALLIIIFLF